MPDILEQIVSARRADYRQKGATFGVAVPDHRKRPLVPFLREPGTILEIKRASPSRGDIAPDLDPVTLAGHYREAGTKNISILTEERFFKGSLNDFLAVSDRIYDVALLRKDFILYEDEIDVSWRAGADAVLLIARILETETLLRLAQRCRSFSMTPLIEVRESADLDKLSAAAAGGPVIAGVNSRDLATFQIDPLVPAIMRRKLPGTSVFESGATTPGACQFARRLGFEGLLIGEAAARSPENAGRLVSAFSSARPDWAGQFWREMGQRLQAAREKGRPLVKVCGLTNTDDALLAAKNGADLLGFIFAESPRKTDAATVRAIGAKISAEGYSLPGKLPLLVGVVTETESAAAREAFSLVCEGVLDAIQYHGENPGRDLPRIDRAGGDYGIGKYSVVRLGSEADLSRIDTLLENGEPRVLVDARVEGIAGGTGKTIPRNLVRKVRDHGGLWLAGGIGPANIRRYLEEFSPELVDVSSSLESAPGKKDGTLIASFFREIES